MKYKIGDKFVSECVIEKTDDSSVPYYEVWSDGRDEWFRESELDNLKENEISTHEESVNEVWKMLNDIKILSDEDLNRIFGTNSLESMLEEYSDKPMEAIEKYKEYQNSIIRVGDLVELEQVKERAVIISIENGKYWAVTKRFGVQCVLTPKFKKTGESVDLSELFKALGNEEEK